MIVYVCGADAYRRRAKIKKYLEQYQVKYGGTSLRYFDFDESDSWEAFKNHIQAFSLFDTARLALIRNFSSLESGYRKEALAALKALLENKELTILIEDADTPTKDAAFFKKRPAIYWEFPKLQGQELRTFIRSEAIARNLIIDQAAEESLAASSAGDSWALINELDMLALTGTSAINKAVVQRFIQRNAPVDFFSSITALRSHSLASRLAALEVSLTHYDPAAVFNVAAALPARGIHEQEKTADYDVAVKSGKLEYEEVLTDWALT